MPARLKHCQHQDGIHGEGNSVHETSIVILMLVMCTAQQEYVHHSIGFTSSVRFKAALQLPACEMGLFIQYTSIIALCKMWLKEACVGALLRLREACVGALLRLREACVGALLRLREACVGALLRLRGACVGALLRLRGACVGALLRLREACVGALLRLREACVGALLRLREACVGALLSVWMTVISGCGSWEVEASHPSCTNTPSLPLVLWPVCRACSGISV